MARDDKDPTLGRDLTEAEVFAQRVKEATQMAEMKQAESRLHRSADSTQGCYATEGAIGTADQEARYGLQSLINVKTTRIDLAQKEAQDAHYLRALYDALPTKMSHDAAMGLKLLVRSYGNTPRY